MWFLLPVVEAVARSDAECLRSRLRLRGVARRGTPTPPSSIWGKRQLTVALTFSARLTSQGKITFVSLPPPSGRSILSVLVELAPCTKNNKNIFIY